MDSIEFAVLSKLQDLGNCFGLKPYNLVARLDHCDSLTDIRVKFVIPLGTSEREEARVLEMLQMIGVDKDCILKGGPLDVINALDSALQKAPKPRTLG